MLKKIFLIIFFLTLGCSQKKDEPKAEKVPVSSVDNLRPTCLRWFDRDIYFATSDPLVSNRNNQFHKDIIKNAIKTLEYNSKMGEDYIRFRESSPEVLDPLTPTGLSRSFILIWEDTKFEAFANTYISGGLSALRDKNAMTVTNPNAQRKFYMIFRASCFDSSSKCAAGDNTGINSTGASALVMRQFGYLARMTPQNCSVLSDANERNNVMCALPSDNQFSSASLTQFYTGFSSTLQGIVDNANFYNDANPNGCLTRPFMDQNIIPACSQDAKNNIFRILDVYGVLDEIACGSMLGCKYFNTGDPAANPAPANPRPSCIAENTINLSLERQDGVDVSTSHLMIWDDTSMNNFINGSEITFPELNSVVIVNGASKRYSQLIFRNSCFDAFNPNCDSGNGGISTAGMKAMVARQMGVLVGIPYRSCADYPNDVMCADLPNDKQWTPESKDRFLNRFNNYLELIGNIPQFYDKQVIENDAE